MSYRSIKRAIASVLGVAAICTAGVSGAGTIGTALQERLQELGPDDEVAIIVRLKDKVDVRAFKDLDRSERRSKILKALHAKADQSLAPLRVVLNQGRVHRMQDLWLINGIAASVPAHRVGALANRPWIGNISLDMMLAAPTVTYGVTSTPGWNLTAVAAPAAPYGVKFKVKDNLGIGEVFLIWVLNDGAPETLSVEPDSFGKCVESIAPVSVSVGDSIGYKIVD